MYLYKNKYLKTNKDWSNDQSLYKKVPPLGFEPRPN